MQIVPLSLCYKGDRNYLHGTDIWNAVIGHLLRYRGESSPKDIRLVIHHFATRQLELCLADAGVPEAPPSAPIAADFRAMIKTGPLTGWLRETFDTVTCRVPYDEGKISELCDVTGETIRIRGEAGYTPIEVLVSMTKQLHYRLFPIEQGRWIFTRLDLARVFRESDAAGLSVVQEQNLHNRLTRSRVEAGGAKIGDIYFSVATGPWG